MTKVSERKEMSRTKDAQKERRVEKTQRLTLSYRCVNRVDEKRSDG